MGGTAIIKGIRDTADLRYELQQANTNRLAGGIETLFMLTGDQHALTSSTLIKQIAAMGGDISSMVPPAVAEDLARLADFPAPLDAVGTFLGAIADGKPPPPVPGDLPESLQQILDALVETIGNNDPAS